ncbi:integrin alpha-6-like [Periophthalmus magnuspinnatus]|uniref:integrin alpha-6-like n=1 Tax=Periophthalmus magnuspinnatus TaxID=409849 RepID=UPI00145ADD91|nr:integrin alpha-6-like [Periophthalmus magnuspinnatus]
MVKKTSIAYLWIYSWIAGISCFNIETEHALQKHGDPDSLFGFSIAFHQQLSPTRKNLLLVGAPQSKHQHHENATGVVYKCELGDASQHCQPIQFDNEEFLDSKGINGQWMGVRVTSQGPGRNVMMCAHRYREWIPGQYVPHVLTGQCYLLGDDLRAGGEERTWRRVVCDSQHLLSRRMDHEWFAYCQQGHGATFAKDNTSVIFGAPGAYQWKGIVRMEPLDNTDIDSEDPRETGDVNQFNPKLIPLHRSSYLGFSIDTGLSLVRKGELTIVSGAPRGGYSGQVTFLKVDPVARKNLSVEFILSGPGLASSFGYDLAVVDLNGDGWDDLVVGAPQYFVKDGEVGGAVYIYINNKGTNWGHTKPIQLLGHTDSMFGLAVENIGDINQDGFGDIAVGAPYEGSGRVYIYCGSSKGINQKSAQVISPASDTVTLFGYSLSGNMDVDNNHYPDLAVGALSGTVFVYRAKPVVSISISLKVTPNTIDITKEQCQTQTCYFTAKACYRYTANLETFSPKLLLNYTFEADSERRKVRLSPRMDFLDPNRGLLELPAQNVEKCTTTRLKLVREITDKLRKIPISVTISLVSSSPSLQTSQSDLSPVLNLYQRKNAVSEITLINTGCGLDNVCQSQLAIEYKFCSVQKQKSKNVFKSLHRDNGLAVITPSDGDIALEITATNRNGDDAHQSGLSITLPDTLHYTTVYHTQAKSPVSCTANKKGTLINCELGNPLQRDGEVTFYVILATSGISLSTKHVNVTLLLETTSEQLIRPVEAFARVMFELKLQVHGLTRPSQVSMGESWKGESAINSLQEIGTPVQYEFRITNLGRPLKSFANISLNIFWPKENAVGKWLLYLTHISSKGVQPSLCSPATEINPLKEIKGWSDKQRRKRQVEGELEPLSTEDILFQPLKRTHKTLTCSDGLGCVEIRCPLHGLDSNAFIMLHSYLWNTTFTEDYSSLNYLEIVVDAALSLTQSPENIGLISDESVAKVKLTVFLEKEVEYLTKVAWWIILLTVIALLLLLVFATFIMCKYGPANFFSPNKKQNNEEQMEPLSNSSALPY